MSDKVRRIDWSPSEWLAGTRGVLSPFEVGIYDLVLNTIYDRGGRAPNDAEFVFGHFKPMYRTNHHLTRRGELRMVRDALDQLVALGKLHVSPDGEWLTNGRADIELSKAGERIVGAARAGVASGAARRALRNLPVTSPAPPRKLPDGSRERHAQSSNVNDLARTSVRNHQPPTINTDREISTEAARASRPATRGPPARAPDTKPKKPTKTDKRLEELARKFHEDQR
jgi:hypothetical protein